MSKTIEERVQELWNKIELERFECLELMGLCGTFPSKLEMRKRFEKTGHLTQEGYDRLILGKPENHAIDAIEYTYSDRWLAGWAVKLTTKKSKSYFGAHLSATTKQILKEIIEKYPEILDQDLVNHMVPIWIKYPKPIKKDT